MGLYPSGQHTIHLFTDTALVTGRVGMKSLFGGAKGAVPRWMGG